MSQRIALRFLLALAWLPLSVMAGQQANEKQPTIIIDGPQAIKLQTPIQFSNEGVRDGGGQFLPWHQIISGQFANDEQSQFDLLLKNVGIPLFRLHHRLESGDWPAAREATQDLRNLNFEPASRIPVWIALADFHAEILDHHREQAAVNLIEICQLTRSPKTQPIEFQGSLVTTDEAKSAFAKILSPIFFDPAAAQTANKQLDARFESTPGLNQVWGTKVYSVALLLASNDVETAQSQLEKWELSSEPSLKDWHRVYSAAIEVLSNRMGGSVVRLENEYSKMAPSAKMVASYWIKKAATQRAQTDRQFRDATLSWIAFAAEFKESDLDLAAAGLDAARQIAQTQKWEFEMNSLRTELLKNYSNTYHGRKIKDE